MSGAVLVHRLRVVEALVLMLVARLLRVAVPMRRWSRILGPKGPVAVDAGGARPALLAGDEGRVATAVSAGARRISANCLEQAVAASLMLRRRGAPSVVVIGLDRERPREAPHAWVVGPSRSVVVGGEVMERFRAVNQFGALR